MVTSHTSQYLVRQAKRNGATGFIAKPYITENIVELIQKYQKRHELEKTILKRRGLQMQASGKVNKENSISTY